MKAVYFLVAFRRTQRCPKHVCNMRALHFGSLILSILGLAIPADAADVSTLRLPWGTYEGRPFDGDANVSGQEYIVPKSPH